MAMSVPVSLFGQGRITRLLRRVYFVFIFLLAISSEMEVGKEVIVLKPRKQGGLGFTVGFSPFLLAAPEN